MAIIDVEAFGIGMHEAVLNTIVEHFTKCPAPTGPQYRYLSSADEARVSFSRVTVPGGSRRQPLDVQGKILFPNSFSGAFSSTRDGVGESI
jgi:hypothetical protein